LCILLSSSFGVQNTRAAVSLVFFFGIPHDQSVTLEWQTAGELNLEGFNVYRSVNQNSDYIKINQNLIPSEGDPLLGEYYQLTDLQLTNGTTYYYRLDLVSTDGGVLRYGPLQVVPGSESTAAAPLTPGVTPGSGTIPATVTPTTSGTPGATRTTTRTPTGTQILLPTDTPTPPIPTITLTPTLSPTSTVTPSPTQTPTGAVLLIDTLTPDIKPDMNATGTAIAAQIATELAAQLTPEPEPVDKGLSSQDWVRIGLLVLVGGVWLLLGFWLYYYLTRMNQ
jgi:hypothetical protein